MAACASEANRPSGGSGPSPASGRCPRPRLPENGHATQIDGGQPELTEPELQLERRGLPRIDHVSHSAHLPHYHPHRIEYRQYLQRSLVPSLACPPPPRELPHSRNR